MTGGREPRDQRARRLRTPGAMPGHKPLFSLASVAAAALALAAVAVVSRQHRSMYGAGSGAASRVEPELSVARLRRLPGGPFFRLVRAFYESRNFHLHHGVRRGAWHDADLYFGTLPHAVGVLRVLAGGRNRVGVADIEDLPETMRRRGVHRAIVHATGEYTHEAAAFAHAHHIRLVTVQDLGANIAQLPLASRLALCASLANAGNDAHQQQELELE